jgi:hypothetical protein
MDGFLSIFGSLFIIFTYWFLKEERTMTLRLVMYMSIADCLASVSVIVQNFMIINGYADQTCGWLAGVEYFFYLQTILWTSCIAHNIFSTLKVGNQRRREIIYLLIWYSLIYDLTAKAAEYPQYLLLRWL